MKKIKQEQVVTTVKTLYQSIDEKFYFETKEQCATYEILNFVKAYDENKNLVDNTKYTFAYELLNEFFLVVPVELKETILYVFNEEAIDFEIDFFDTNKAVNNHYYLTTIENDKGFLTFAHAFDVINNLQKEIDDVYSMINTAYHDIEKEEK